MNLDEIIIRAIPVTAKDCRIEKAKKEAKRAEMKKRILEWHEEQIKTLLRDMAKGGTVQGPMLAIVGDHKGL